MKLDDLVPAATVQVDLGFARAPGGSTVLKRQHTAYPFHVGRVLRLPGDPPGLANVCLQSCSGGLFQGERLQLALSAGAGTQARLTTAAATIVHTMAADHAEQSLWLDAATSALIEYWPEPLILFPGSRYDTRIRIRAHKDSTVIAGESILHHDPGCHGASFDWIRSETRIEDEEGRLLAVDRFRAEGATVAAGQPGVNGAFQLQATVMAVHRADPAAALAALRRALQGAPDVYAGASLLPGRCGAWMRLLANDAIALRAALGAARNELRQMVHGAQPGLSLN